MKTEIKTRTEASVKIARISAVAGATVVFGVLSGFLLTFFAIQ